MYIVDAQYFQVIFYIISLTISHTFKRCFKLTTLRVCECLLLENWHMCFIFEQGSNGSGVAIALCHFVIECKKLVNFTNVC